MRQPRFPEADTVRQAVLAHEAALAAVDNAELKYTKVKRAYQDLMAVPVPKPAFEELWEEWEVPCPGGSYGMFHGISPSATSLELLEQETAALKARLVANEKMSAAHDAVGAALVQLELAQSRLRAVFSGFPGQTSE